jgi:photosystem II stability/assembly factor-like uncharacterized protein
MTIFGLFRNASLVVLTKLSPRFRDTDDHRCIFYPDNCYVLHSNGECVYYSCGGTDSGTPCSRNCCPPGMYYPSDEPGQCYSCPENTYTSGYGYTSCTSCPPGTNSTGGSYVCSIHLTASPAAHSAHPDLVTVNPTFLPSPEPTAKTANRTFYKTSASSSTFGWGGLASNSSGSLLVAAQYDGQVFTSNNYGNGWTATPLVAYLWVGATASYSGQYIAVAANGNYIYVSSDFGNSWLRANGTSPAVGWRCIASDNSGQYMVAGSSQGSYSAIYLSSNYGKFWKISAAPTSTLWTGVASSSNGQNLIGCSSPGYIYTSSNFGNSWTAQLSSPSTGWYSVTSSSTGQYSAACVYGGSIYTSNNFGKSWSLTTAPPNDWLSISSSSNGQFLMAGNTLNLYTSSNYGYSWFLATGNWTPEDGYWRAVVVSSDGSYGAAAGYNGIYSTVAPLSSFEPTTVPSVCPTLTPSSPQSSTVRPSATASNQPVSAFSKNPSLLPTASGSIQPTSVTTVDSTLSPTVAASPRTANATVSPTTSTAFAPTADPTTSGGQQVSSGAVAGIVIAGVLLLLIVVMFLVKFGYISRTTPLTTILAIRSMSVELPSMVGKAVSSVSTAAFVANSRVGTNHKLLGTWRYVFLLSSLLVSATSLAVFLFYFLYYDCDLTNVTVPVSVLTEVDTITSANFQLTIDNIFSSWTAHYCSAAVLALSYLDTYIWYGCQLDLYPANWHQCKQFQSIPVLTNLTCTNVTGYANLVSVSVNYVQCASIAASFTNAIQYMLYCQFLWCFVYLIIRIIREDGFCRVFSPDKWQEILDSARDTLCKTPDEQRAKEERKSVQEKKCPEQAVLNVFHDQQMNSTL